MPTKHLVMLKKKLRLLTKQNILIIVILNFSKQIEIHFTAARKQKSLFCVIDDL